MQGEVPCVKGEGFGGICNCLNLQLQSGIMNSRQHIGPQAARLRSGAADTVHTCWLALKAAQWGCCKMHLHNQSRPAVNETVLVSCFFAAGDCYAVAQTTAL